MFLSFAVVTIGLVSIVGCNGGDTSGGKQDYSGSDFVGDSTTTGRITVSLTSDSINTGSTGEFSAVAYDSKGGPIRDIPIVCDSEAGVAVVEPSSGRAVTSSRGGISGVVGCSRPGSFRFGCRLGSAGGIREFVSLKCEGAVPLGFTGFPGAAGGGLGGGVADDSGPIRITGITVSSTQQGAVTPGVVEGVIDVDACYCNNDTPADTADDRLEFFSDDRLNVSVVNSSTSSFTVTGVRYIVSNGAANREISSNIISYSEEIPSGQSENLDVLFLKASIPNKIYFNSSSTLVPKQDIFRNVTVIVTGLDGNGNPVTLEGSTGISFGNFDVCTAGDCRTS